MQKAPGYGTYLDWQSKLSIDDLADANDALDAAAEAQRVLELNRPR